MRRVMLVVAYDGTNYRGWQVQPNGITIEQVLNETLSALLGENIAIIGASRTDSGVHALGNVAVFDTESRMPADKICFALNQRLPEDIRVQRSFQVAGDFHPRKANCIKTYEYRILNRKISLPTSRLYAHFCYFDLDLEKMRRAAEYLTGEHDFKSFCTVKTQAEETVRRVEEIAVEREGEMVVIRIRGNGFLYNMVRIIAGTLMKVGMGVYPPEYVEEILEARDREKAGPKVPARGLTLVSLDYEETLRPVIEGRNRHYAYRLEQGAVETAGEASLWIERAEEEEFAPLVRRTVHQAFRNGAVRVILKDAGGRLREGQQYGFYRIEAREENGIRQMVAVYDPAEGCDE